MPLGSAGLLLALGTLSACVAKRVEWPKHADCDAVSREAEAEVFRTLSSDGEATKLSPRAREALNRLAEEHGPNAVVCPIREMVHTSNYAGGPLSAEFKNAALRGSNFLREVGTSSEPEWADDAR